MIPRVPLLEANSLRKAYGPSVVAVNNVSLRIERGTLVLLTGPSGSGKTTLLALLGALERPDSGWVAFDGTNLSRSSGSELARVRRRYGFIFQDFGLIPNLSTIDNITYPLIPRGIVRSERRRRAEEWLARFGLHGKLGIRSGRMSGGAQQRGAIARALALRPDVLFADEPTSNLDAESARLFSTVVKEYQDSGGTAVIASHDMRLSGLATEQWEMVDGTLVGYPSQ
jgi:putative ABC transport system ATP-binding protein